MADDALVQILFNLGFDILQVILAIILSAIAAYSGIKLIDSITRDLELWKELRKGNVAIGIFFSSVLVSLFILMQSTIGPLAFSIAPNVQPIAIMLRLFNYVGSILLGMLVIYISLNVIEALTSDLHDFSEIKKGNIAVALMFSVMLLAISIFASAPMAWIFQTI